MPSLLEQTRWIVISQAVTRMWLPMRAFLRPQRPSLKSNSCAPRPAREPNLAEGFALARRKGIPIIFPAEKSLASLAPPGWAIPLPCALPPHLRQEAFGMYMPRFNADVQEPEPQGEHP
jgi:hypothetical protein